MRKNFDNPYKVIFNPYLPEKLQANTVVAIVEDFHRNMVIARVVVNDEYLRKAKMRDMVVTASVPAEIIVTEFFAKRLIKKECCANTMLFHEIGHIHFKHFLGVVSQEKIRQERIGAILNGGVCDSEIEADEFAAKVLGKVKVIEALEQLRNDRYAFDKEHGNLGKTNSVLAIKELDYRIKMLNEA